MPTYQYECAACGHAFEELQSMTDAKLTKCPKCGKKKLDRLIGGGSGMIFKGSGFYQTDYKNKPAPEAPASTPKPAGPCGGGCACHG
jgi:putative FmdB family regulatory protein